MATIVSNAFEIERRGIMWTPLITLNDGSTALGWDADPNTVVNGNSDGESWLYILPIGQFYKQNDSTLWWKSASPNTWINLSGGDGQAALDYLQEDITVEENYQYMIYNKLKVDGTILLDGKLVII